VRKIFADQQLGKVTVQAAAIAGTMVAIEIALPGFVASAEACFRAVRAALGATPLGVEIVRLAAVRQTLEPDGSWVWARESWNSEQAEPAQTKDGRCPCVIVCAGCIPPDGGWRVRLEVPATSTALGDVVNVTIEYKAEAKAPCCTIEPRCGSPIVPALPYGSMPTLTIVYA